MAERDYKKEYAKFQSSPKRKKYRAELNKYNRSKGTYGNGDGKDASHKGGKISGYEAEGKNRGRREKSRLKGSKRKTEGVTQRSGAMGRQTLREYVREETKRELRERLSARWNIVAGGDGRDEVTKALSAIINKRDLERAAKEGNSDYIQQVVKRVTRLRHRIGKNIGPEHADRVDDVMMNLLRMYMQVRKRARSVNEAGNPVGKAQIALHKKLTTLGTAQSHHLSDLIKFDSQFRGIHFGALQKAADVLKKKGLVTWDGTSKISLIDVVTERKMTKNQVALIDRLRKKGPGWHDLIGNDEERAAAQLAGNTGQLDDAPTLQHSYGARVARLLEGDTITEVTSPKTRAAVKKFISKHSDSKLRDYLWAVVSAGHGAQPYPEEFDVDNHTGYGANNALEIVMREAESAWGKPESPSTANDPETSDPKPVPEELDEADYIGNTADVTNIGERHMVLVYAKRLAIKGKKKEADYANEYSEWKHRGDRAGRAKGELPPMGPRLSTGASKKIRTDVEAILRKGWHKVDKAELKRLKLDI